MKDDPFAPEYKESIDADAVCGQCGKVNPEGSLICRTCGNNLRDQRLLRLAADATLAGEEAAQKRRNLLIGLVTALGLLVFMWLALNAGGIMRSMTSASEETEGSGTPTARPFKFWSGPDQGKFDQLAEKLKAGFPTESAAETAKMNSTVSSSLHGYYALFDKVGTTETFAGAAYVESSVEAASFAATLNNGTEIRGNISVKPEGMLADWQNIGVKQEGTYHIGAGSGAAQSDGSYIIMASSDIMTRSLQVVAYPVSGN